MYSPAEAQGAFHDTPSRYSSIKTRCINI